MNNVTVIIHGRLGRQAEMRAELEHELGHAVVWLVTAYAGHAIELATQAAQNGVTHIIAIGGDGTLHEVANGIYLSQQTTVIMGILPRGSGNDFVRTLGASHSIASIAKAIKQNKFRSIDIGICTFVDTNQQTRKRICINITDIGIGGTIAEQISRSSRWAGAFLTYQYHIVRSLLMFRKCKVNVQADSFNITVPVMSVVIANGKYFGTALGIAPDADLEDGVLQAVVLADISLLDYLRHLTDLRACRRIIHPQVSYHNVKEVRITIPEQPNVPIDIDGEFVGFTPLHIMIAPKWLRILA